MHPITITIAVRPYVKKFIQARYEQQVWQINKHERVGKMLYCMLERMPVRQDKTYLMLGDTLSIEISHDYARNKGIHLSNDNIIQLNEFIQDEIVEMMAMYAFGIKNRLGLKKYSELYVKHRRKTGTSTRVVQDPDLYQYFEKREIISDFLKLYDISENDLRVETVLKSWQRLKLPMLIAS